MWQRHTLRPEYGPEYGPYLAERREEDLHDRLVPSPFLYENGSALSFGRRGAS